MTDPKTTDSPAFDPKPFLRTLTEEPGVYRMIGADDKVLYVGKAKNLKRRVSSYFQKTVSSPRIAMMVAQVLRVGYVWNRATTGISHWPQMIAAQVRAKRLCNGGAI